jgi:hypothetical protein
MPESLTRKLNTNVGRNRMSHCAFCGSPSTLLCGGKLEDGKSCDKPLCRRCAHREAHVCLATQYGRRGDTRDLCPDCVRAGRHWLKLEA